MANKPNFVASADAKVLSDLMRRAAVGDTLTYEAMSAAINRDVTADRSLLYTARGIVQREDRVVFDSVQKVGLKRLADTEIVSLGDRARSRVRRIAKRASQAIVCVNYDTMPRDAQVKHNTALSMLGVVQELATDKSFLKLQKHVDTAGTELPVGKASIAALGLIFGRPDGAAQASSVPA